MGRNVIIWIIFISPFCNLVTAQHQHHVEIKGEVSEKDENNKQRPVPYANIYWVESQTGVIADSSGRFELHKHEGDENLVISAVGYNADTFQVKNQIFLGVKLEKGLQLEEAEVTHRQKSSEISYLSARNTRVISQHELTKAACCNLAESFETNPSIDVSFTDAVTGTRQIQMLGLAGTYTDISRENMPGVRGLASVYGLSFIPGPWIESIQLSKGAGSVVNGYEGVTGQLNVELRKPQNPEQFYINGFINQEGRSEANYVQNQMVTKNLGTSILLHASGRLYEIDNNGDDFLDFPTGRQINLVNRWEYHNQHGLHSQIGINVLDDTKQAGQVGFFPDKPTNRFGVEMNTRRYEGWGKTGFIFPNQISSLGFQYAGLVHEFDSYFGDRSYDANEKTFYGNLIFQTALNNSNHKIKTGVSFLHDDYDESLDSMSFARAENVPGVFLEYTYDFTDKFNAILGARYDFHNLYGNFFTPRAHLRYAFSENTVVRATVGKGTRSPNVFSENIGVFSSSRRFVFNPGETVDDFKPEVAWNAGISFTQNFRLNYRRGSFVMDYYKTWFENQVIVDMERSPQEVWFYNLDGESYSNSIQAQLDYELIRWLDVRMAYRLYDVKSTYNGELLSKPLTSSQRAFLNLGYKTKSDWKFDYTLNWQGRKRIPNTQSNPEAYQLDGYSPDFIMMNMQVSKAFKDVLEVYIGGENLLDFTQKNPILSYDEPFSPYFDSSLIWGPISGRMFYIGFRFKVLK